ncbi:MAG: hypothetical protein GWP41_06935 [Planctomycetia bacterium]|jgi:tRNA A37 threonylcarbamoyladenosine synthetase subunit TsaC/SUA5/YrdC|nr:hypothetical protein [Planctomycetia bacterium]NCF98049.1 hypothetical protein [Planctomycetia bacterium]NCG13077.1 hypothetical protein [Planctomycetia bacterium]NCG57377.1 hypothetical protein [Pseudomonadota bacterium]
MQQIHIEDPNAIETIIEHVRHEAVLLQLPTVYTLVAAPHQQGVSQLNHLKDRLDGKNYGTVMGRAERFLQQVRPGALPSYFQGIRQLEEMQGAFVRAAFTDQDFESPVLRNGTHQSLILDGVHRSLFCHAEDRLQDEVDLDLWGGRRVSSLLCTSANLSGDPLGSITDRQRALTFAKERGIRLFVHCNADDQAKGSYPIFEFAGDSVSVQRKGPGLDRLLAKIPASIQQNGAA